MAPKRRLFLAAGDNGGAPPGKRLRVAAAAGPPSPCRRLLRQTVFVVLFLIRARDRNATDSISQIGRVVREEVRRCFDPIFRGYSLLVSKLEGIEERIQALTHKVDQITPSRPNHHNHQQLGHESNQEGTIEEGLATNKGEDKSTIVRLRFLDGMKTPIYHDDEIKADSNGAIKIGIFDGEEMVKSGKLSKVRVEIVALEGNFPYDVADSWTAKEFNEHRAGGRDGKGNVLAGKCTVQLINGVASLGSIKFREGSCRARNGMFIVGARVCDCVRTVGRVQEAVMNPVVVQDRRNKANEKSYPPKLDDRVHRLEEIANDGIYCKRLEEKQIFTVQDFLRALNKNPDNLTKVLKIKKEHKPWEKMVRHAQDCCLKGKHELKSCRYTEGNVVLFFNFVHFLVGAVFDGHYTASDKFSPAQQAIVDKLKERAYDQLDALSFDHVMKDDFPVPIPMNTGASAGSPYMSSAAQPNHSGRYTAHQVGGIAAVEGLNHTHMESSFANLNDNPTSSLPDHHNKHDYQDQGTRPAGQERQFSSASGADWCRNTFGQLNSSHQTTDGFYYVAGAEDDMNTDTGVGSPYMSGAAQPNHSGLYTAHQVGGIAAVEGLNHAQIESSFANSNDNPSSSLPDHHNKHDYQDQGTRPAGQEQQFSSASGADWCHNPFGQLNSSHQMTDGFYHVAGAEDDVMAFLLDQAHGIDQPDCVAPASDQVELQRQHFSHRDDILEASTSTRSSIPLTTQQLTFHGAAGPAQVSRPRCQGSMPWDSGTLTSVATDMGMAEPSYSERYQEP